MRSKGFSVAGVTAAVLFASLRGVACLAGELCDDFPEHHGEWTLRLPKCGPTASLDESDGFLRIHVPSGAASSGDFDNWVGADRAPSIQRVDMGDGDWTISTREVLVWVGGGTVTNWGVGLAVGFGTDVDNERIMWGLYGQDGQLVIEHTGSELGRYAIEPGPVSVQIQKSGNTYTFRHRIDDSLDWTVDNVVTSLITSGRPVSWVGLYAKTFGGVASPELIADFDYFCLDAPGLTAPGPVTTDEIPAASPLADLSCELEDDGSIALSWFNPPCAGILGTITVSIAGQVVATLPADATETVIRPPFPGGSIVTVTVQNDPGNPLSCTVSKPIVDECDEFELDPLETGVWDQFRVPSTYRVSPTISVEENPGFLRLHVPSGAIAGGDFDNWVGADRAPSLQRVDMGDGDWTISTREVLVSVGQGNVTQWGVGLAVGFGTDADNERIMWGLYGQDGQLVIEHTGSELGRFAVEPGPVSVQIQKSGNNYTFRHRSDDSLEWTVDKVATSVITSGRPVSWVGLYGKTFGGTSAPEVTVDFDYFCVQIPDSPPVASIQAEPRTGMAPLEVQFSGAESVDPSGGSLTYLWDFGDGSTGAGAQVKHTFTRGGIYTVTLTVTDNEKNSGQARITVAVSDDPSPFVCARLGPAADDNIVTVDLAAPNQYCLRASGTTLGLTADQGLFLYRTLSGDFRVDAKIVGGSFDASRARAGLMARLSTNASSANVMMSIDGANDGFQFQYRKSNGGSTGVFSTTVEPPRGPLPAWVRLERSGETFIGSYSRDGVTYFEYGRQDLPNLNVGDLLVGFAATSGDAENASQYCAVLSGFDGGGVRPARPTGLVAAAGDGKVVLDWNDNSEGDLRGYNLYRSAAGGAFLRVNATLIATSAYEDTGLANGTEYCYRVRAVNPAGESEDSDPACATPQSGGGNRFRRGDTNADGSLNITDGIFVLNYLFLGGQTPPCLEAAEVNDDGNLNITDGIFLLNYLFLGGSAPPAPGPEACGPDTDADAFDCAEYPQTTC